MRTNLVLILVGMVYLAGCSRGLIDFTAPGGEHWRVNSPSDPTKPATFIRSPDGTVSISTGAQQEQTPAMIAAGKVWVSYLIGGLIALVGVGMLVAKKYMPLIPTSAGTYTILIGAGVIVAATVSVTIPWWGWAIAAGAGLVIVAPGLWANAKTQTAAKAAGAST